MCKESSPKKAHPQDDAPLRGVPCASRVLGAPHRHDIPVVAMLGRHPVGPPLRALRCSAPSRGTQSQKRRKKQRQKRLCFSRCCAFDVPPLESAEHRSPCRTGSRSEARQEPMPFRRARDGASESPTRARSTGNPRSGRSMGCVSFGYIFLAHTKKSNPPGEGGIKALSTRR